MKTRALFLALPLLALGAVGGCRDNSASLQIQAMCFPTDDCTFGSTCDNSFMGTPVLDPTLVNTTASGGLTLIFQLENQAPDNEDLDVGRTNTKDAQVDQVVIEYDGPAIPRQVKGTNVWIPANGNTLILIPVIPPGFQAALTAYGTTNGREMTARVRLGGFWYDGSRFETAEFPVAVEICNGCAGASGVCGGFQTCPPSSSGQQPATCMEPDSAGTT
jgi:hypothetical protein